MSMNQFNNIDFKGNKEALSIAEEFDFILNNIWTKFTYQKGLYRWIRVAERVEKPFRKRINTEIGHVDLGYGINDARLAVKDEMVKYLEYLINDN